MSATLTSGSLTARVVETLATLGVGTPIRSAELAATLGETRVRVGRVLTRLSRFPGGPIVRGERRRVRTYIVGAAIAEAAMQRRILMAVGVDSPVSPSLADRASFRVAA